MKRRNADGSLMEQYEDQASVARRANRETERALKIAALRKQKADLVRRGFSPYALPLVTDSMSDADLAIAVQRFSTVTGNPAANPAMGTNGRNPLAGTIVPRKAPVTPAVSGQAISQAGNDIGNALAQATGMPGSIASPMDALSVPPAAQPEGQMEAAFRRQNPLMTNAEIHMTPAGPMVMMETDSGQRLVPYQPSGAEAMEGKMGQDYMRMTPQERAARLTEVMPSAPQRGTTTGAPQTIYSDEMGRSKTALDGVTGMTNMGKGTLNPDGTVAFTVGGAGITPVAGARPTVQQDGTRIIEGGKYQEPGSVATGTFSPEDLARHAIEQAPRPRVVSGPKAPAGTAPSTAALPGPFEGASIKGEVGKGQSDPFAGAAMTGTPLDELTASNVAVGIEEASAAGKAKKEQESLAAGLKQGNREMQIKANKQKAQQIRDKANRPDPTRNFIDTGIFQPGVTSMGQDNKGTGNGRLVAPTPLGLTSTTNDVVDHFARNPEEDQFRKKLAFSGFDKTYA